MPAAVEPGDRGQSAPGVGGRGLPAAAGAGISTTPAGAATGGGDPSAVSTAAEATKRCPYCGEVILAVARKCKHCGEFLDREPPAALVGGGAGTPAAAGGGAASATSADDEPAFSLSVSQWDNFWKFLITITVAVAIGAVFVFLPPLKKYGPPAVLGICLIALAILWYFYLAAKHTRVHVRPWHRHRAGHRRQRSQFAGPVPRHPPGFEAGHG